MKKIFIVAISLIMMFMFAANAAVFKLGDTGADVKELQTALTELGYNIGVPDGIFGKGTQAAVIDFQTKHKLTADGIIGDGTIALMYKELNKDIPVFNTTPSATSSKKATGVKDGKYVVNTSTKVIHYKTCRFVKKIKDENRIEVNEIGKYKPCEVCNCK